ncbi:SIMPL domain-containing protein [Bordetella petrii]|uniref:SIMPL domain-containing protein n=1 Tax=Bordetella petrii TaxID=94624 RepID=UPI001E48A9FA|nr:SIMPL domain-containing protein [Bordetella petrii]MCD0504081.1 SIMPL domain-containing protein [Bordetella petrii]
MHSHPVLSLNRIVAACCAALALAAAQPALAQQPQPASQADEAVRAPELSLQASASSEVQQDTVRITLAVELEAASQSAAGQELSNALDAAFKRAQGNKGVEVRTGGFSVWPNTNEKGKIQNWRGRGEITLESKDFAAASALANKLSDKTAITQINFLLSREAREAEERKLLSQAAEAFRERALAAATAFGFKGYQVRHLELSGGGSQVPVPRPMGAQMMAKSSRAEAADVPLEAGQVTVSISVNGTVALH